MKNRFKGTKGSFIFIILVLLVLSYSYYLSNKNTDKRNEDVAISSAEEIIMKNYSINYPPTPKEVVKEYLQISKVLHNDALTDEQIEQIALKAQQLYDDEFVANKSQEEYIRDLKSEVAIFRENNYSIANYYTASSTEVVYGTVDGYDFAKLNATYALRVDGNHQTLTETYLLRKDSAGRWRIYGWQPAQEEEADE